MAATILLCAGGTGGHLFPAEALGHELRARGFALHLATDKRAERFTGIFPADEIHIIPSATITSKNPVALAKTGFKLFRGLRRSGRLLSRLRPAAVVGFGGYPTLPPLMAASRRRITSVIHEQNAVMGRANRFLAPRIDVIAGGFLPEGEGPFSDKIVATGNPVRPDVLKAAEKAYKAPTSEEAFHLLVFGGSQGARFFSEILPEALVRVPEALRNRLRVTQQARPEDRETVERFCEDNLVNAEISPFFNDMAGRIARAHLVISRSGASTVSELSVIGRPSILVPFPHALDHDQAANAAALQEKGGAQVIRQSELSAEKLASLLTAFMEQPHLLEEMAKRAKSAGKPDAASLLGDLVEDIADGRSPRKKRSAQQ